MFCPDYGGPCKKEECREWNRKEGKCQQQLNTERRIAMDEEYIKLIGFMKVVAETERLNNLRIQASLHSLLSLPGLPPESREFIQKVLEAPTSEVAKKLIDDLNIQQ